MTDTVSRAQHMDAYLNVYYTNVATTIRALGSDPERLFSRADFDQQLRENAFFGILNGPMSLPGLVCDVEDISDMNELAECAERGTTKEVHLAVLDDQAEISYRKLYSDVMKDAERYGWLDVMWLI